VNGKLVIRSFVSLLVSNVLGQVFALWAIVHLAKILGPAGFGRYSFAQIIGLYAFYLADFGLQTYGSRAVAHSKENLRHHVRDITWVRIGLAFACYGLIAAATSILPMTGEMRVLILIHGAVVFPAALSLEWLYQGLERMEIVGLARILKGLVFGLLVVVLVRFPEHIVEASFFYVGGIAVASLVLLVIYARRYGWMPGLPGVEKARSILVTAASLAAGSFVTQINANFGTFALGIFAANEAVGLFSSAYKIVLFLSGFVVVAAANSTLPQMVKAYAASTTQFWLAVRNLLRLFVLFAFPIGIGGTVLAGRIIGYLYPEQYAEAAVVFRVAIWMVTIMLYRSVFENALIASGSRRQYFLGYMVAGSITVAGNLVLTPVLGLIGPALVAALAEAGLLVCFVSSYRFIRSWHVVTAGIRPFLAAVVMGAVLWLVPVGIFAALALGVGVYAVMLVLFRAVSLEEVRGYARLLGGQAG
jgi:O-antigen/teichoic acid export membrane protein